MKGLIIGAGSGIGAQFASRVLHEPFVMNAGWHTPNQDTLDITDQMAVRRYLEQHGPYDMIVYTAGVNELRWTEELAASDLQRTFAVNTFGFALLCGDHRDIFPEHRVSAVAVVSDSSRTPMRGSLAYCSSKAALVSVIKCLAREFAPLWRVNGVSPGIVEDTPMTNYIDATVPGFRGWDPEKAKAYEESLIPMGRRARKDEVAQVLLDTLVGPEYMTGNITELTGGK